MSLGLALTILQGSWWVGSKVFNLTKYLLYGKPESDIEIIMSRLDKLQLEIKETKDAEMKKTKKQEVRDLIKLQELVNKALEEKAKSNNNLRTVPSKPIDMAQSALF